MHAEKDVIHKAMKETSKRRKRAAAGRRGATKFLADKPKGIKGILAKQGQKKQHELLAALEEISRVLTVEVDLHNILEGMATVVGKVVGAKWVNFWELTPDKKAAYITAAYGMKQSYIDQSREHPIRLGKAWVGRAIKTGKAWGTSDILTDPHLMPDLGPTWKEAIKKQDYHALLCVPTRSRKGTVGGMCVYYPDPHEFSDFEMQLVTVAANQAGTAITNAQIFEDLVTERNKTLAMLNSLSDGLVMYDLENRITAFNPRAEELLWIQSSLVLGKTPAQLAPESNPMLKNLKNISSLTLGDFESRELQITEPQRVSFMITHLPVRDSRQRKIGSMRVLHDITAEKETEEMKSNFISVASHQLRTPLSGIKWSLAMLEDRDLGSLTDKQAELIQKTALINDRLINLINDLLDTSRIEEGRFGYEFKKIDLHALVEEVVESFGARAARDKDVSLVIVKPKQKLPMISVDAKKLKMAIFNIIDNALKYTIKGVIRISFHSGTSSLILEVEDQGIGIPKDQQKFVFTKFFRARNAVLLQTEGSGLGLWIANEIAKRHNARVVFESRENEGSAFSVQFPIAPDLMPKGNIQGL